MSVHSSISKAGPFIADGSQLDFPFQFECLDLAHVAVYNNNVAVPSDEYEVYASGGGPNEPVRENPDLSRGGYVRFLEPPKAGSKVVILRDVPLTQETDLQNNTAFYPELLERGYDKLTMIAQQLAEESERAIKVAPGGNAADAEQLADDLLASRGDAAASAASAAESAAEAAESVRAIAESAAEAAEKAASDASASAVASAASAAESAAEAAESVRAIAESAAEAAEKAASDASASAVASAASAAESAAESRVNLSDLRQAIEAALQRAVGMPMGSIFAFPHDVAPGGAEILDGRPVENFPAKYPAFFSFLQNNNLLVPISEWITDSLRNYSQFVLYDDGTTVQMPDLRGAFIEGAGDNLNTFTAAGLPDISGTWETTVLSSSSIQEGDFGLSGTVSGEKSTVVHFDRLVTAEEGLHYTGRTLEIKGPAPFGESTTVQPRAARYSWCVWCVPTDLREVDVYTRREIDELLANFKPTGGGSVASVNGKTGEVVLNAADVGAYSKEEAKVLDTNLNVLLDAMDSLLGLNVTTLVLYFEESGSYTLRYTMPEGSGYATLQNSETGEIISDVALTAGEEGSAVFDNVPAGVHYLTVGGSMTGLKATTSDGTSPDYNVYQVFAFSQYLTDLEGAFQNCVNLTTFNGAALPGSIVNGDYAFDGCVNLADSLDTLTAGAPEGGYPLTTGRYMFRNCSALTGDQSAFIAACPSLTEEGRVGMFDGSGGGDPEKPYWEVITPTAPTNTDNAFKAEIACDAEGKIGTFSVHATQVAGENVLLEKLPQARVAKTGGTLLDFHIELHELDRGYGKFRLVIDEEEIPDSVVVTLATPDGFVESRLEFTLGVGADVRLTKLFSLPYNRMGVDVRSSGEFSIENGCAFPPFSDLTQIFSYCEGLTAVPDSMVPSAVTTSEYGLFRRCRNLRSVPANIIGPDVEDATFMFQDCLNLELSLDDLAAAAPANGYALRNVSWMFENCAKVTGSRSAFLAKCPYLDSTNTVDMFTGTNTTE